MREPRKPVPGHDPVYSQPRCECGYRPDFLKPTDSPEAWDGALDRHRARYITSWKQTGPRPVREENPLSDQPFNRQLPEAEVRAAMAANPCPHTDVDGDGFCLCCDRPAAAVVRVGEEQR